MGIEGRRGDEERGRGGGSVNGVIWTALDWTGLDWTREGRE